MNQIWFLHPTTWASIKSGQCVCARVFSSFVSTVFTKSAASSFVATQVISHQQKVEVTTVIPYASESVTIESSIHTTCFNQQDNQFFFFFFFGFNTIFLGKGIDNPRQISHMHQTLHLLLPSTYSWNWLFINKKNSASKCFVEPNWKLVNVPVKLNVACETSLVWFVVGNQKSTGAVFSSTFNLRVNSRNIE